MLLFKLLESPISQALMYSFVELWVNKREVKNCGKSFSKSFAEFFFFCYCLLLHIEESNFSKAEFQLENISIQSINFKIHYLYISRLSLKLEDNMLTRSEKIQY